MKKIALLLLTIIITASLFGCGTDVKNESPLVLLTDFGDNDYRTPRLKGYIYSANPEAVIIDGTHGIPAYDIASGAYILDVTASQFPSGVIFIAIVSTPPTPDHEYIVVETEKEQFFVAPDNGLLTYVIENQGLKRAFNITSPEMYEGMVKSQASYDVCGRAGAYIAAGGSIEELGTVLDEPMMLDIQKPSYADGKLAGAVVYIDCYGNCVTNITPSDFAQLGLSTGDTLRATVAGTSTVMTAGTYYGSVATGEEVAFINVMSVLELAVNFGSFAGAHGITPGAKVEIEAHTPNEPELHLAQIRQEVQEELDRLDGSLAAAAKRLSGLKPAGMQARAILEGLAAEYPYIADCSTVSLDGKLVAVEPSSFSENEGADISTQEQVVRLFLTEQPVLSRVFLAVEGFYAVDFEYPVFSPDGRISGAVSALFRPEILFDIIAGPHQRDTFSIWAMQTDGLMLYDEDLEEIGKNTFVDPIYQSFPDLLELGRKMVGTPSGTGSYEFYDTGLSTVITKEAYWTTVGLQGTEWRLVISRNVR